VRKKGIRGSRGFTLIEVMVSLVIFSVVSVALVKNTSMSLRQTGKIEERTTAWWIAENEMTRLRLLPKTDENFPGSGVERSSVETSSADWEVEARIESTENEFVRRVVVEVYKNDQEAPSASLIGFLGRY
jgi:general secretion pathway protein I